jgi:hypothetical protein
MSALLRIFLAGCAVFLVVSPPEAAGQISVGSRSDKTNGFPSPLASESLTGTVTSGIAIGFTLRSNTSSNPGGGTTTVTTSWSSLKVSRTSIAVWVYFNSATSALVHQSPLNTTDIPSAAVMIQVNGVGPFTALTNISPFLGVASGLQLASIAITAGNRTGNVTNTLAYNVDTTKVPQLPADTYVGTLNIQAQAIP